MQKKKQILKDGKNRMKVTSCPEAFQCGTGIFQILSYELRYGVNEKM